MTISSASRKAGPFLGNGVTASFPFTFKVFEAADIQLSKTSAAGVDSILTLNSDYSVALNTDQNVSPGGTITYPLSGVTLATGEKLTAIGVLAALQGTHITNGGNFFANNIEDQMDYLTILAQQLVEQTSRSLIGSSSDISPNLSLGTAGQRALKYVTFDSNGNVSLAQALPSGTLSQASIGSFLFPQTSAESTAGVTPINLWYPPYTPRRYGAVGDGSADDTTPWQQALKACPAGGVVTGYVGDNYRANTLHITKSVSIDLTGCTMISTAYASGMSRKIFYCVTADAVGFVTIKNGRFNGVGTNRGSTAAETEALIWLDTVGTVTLRDLEIFGHAAGIQTVPAALKDRVLSAVLVRWPTLKCTIQNVTVHDNWNEQIGIYNTSGSTAICAALNCNSYAGQVNPANTPIEITGGYASVRDCHLYSSNASVVNINVPNSAEIIGNTLINNAVAGGQGYGINCGQDGLTGYANNVTIADNVIQATMQGGVSVMGSNVKVVNNTISNSGSAALASGGYGIKARAVYNAVSFAALLPDYPALAHQDLVDLLIEGNTINDTVLSGSLTGTAIHVEMTDNFWTGAKYTGFQWRGTTIRNNSIRQPTITGANQLQNGIVLGYAADTIIEGNRIHDANNCPIFVNGQIQNLKISRNKFSATSAASQTGSTVLFFNNATGQTLTFDNVTFEENVFSSYPTPGNFDVQVDTTNAGTSPVVTTNFRFINNQGILMGIGGASISTANYSYRKDDYPMLTALPSTAGATYNQYDVVPAKPTATGVQGWVNVNPAGTVGTLNGGSTTGSITINTTSLVVNSATGLAVGQVISVAGAITSAIVADISGTTLTLTTKATATVAAAAVAFVNPSFKTVGSVGT